METKIKRFLEFNGKSILCLNNEGQYWVAIRPICDAMGINYARTFKNLKSDEIFNKFLSKQIMYGADLRLRIMIALPEKYIEIWIFSIKSKSKALLEYKLRCSQRKVKLTKYRLDHRIDTAEYQKKYNILNGEKAKTRLKNWRQDNREYVNNLQRDEVKKLPDYYIRPLLIKSSIFKNNDIPVELIELKRATLKIKRLIKSKSQNHGKD
jgi:hypothetical protein